jgi:hypothetical protein
MEQIPAARKEGLLIRELPDEMLVYDLERDKAHCLNPTAALVWKHCDGQRTVPELAHMLEDELKVQVDEELIWLALSQLRRTRLLPRLRTGPVGRTNLSRRQVMGQMGLAVAFSLPLVTSIIAPTVAQAATLTCGNCTPPTGECCPAGCPCSTAQSCCAGICNDGVCG